jgi:hypothetical protein
LKFDSNPDVKIFVPKEKKRPKVLAGDFKFKTFLAFVEVYDLCQLKGILEL